MADSENTENTEAGDVDQTLVEEASNMGWVDKDAYKGDPATWVDAKTFVEKGRHVLPILQKNNQRLNAEIGRVSQENKKLADLLKASQESIQALEEYHTEETNRRVEKARKDLKAELVRAKTDGDHAAEVELTDQLSQLNAAEVRAEEAGKGKGDKKPNGNGEDKGEDLSLRPDFKLWASENPWYGIDRRKTHLALAIAEEMRADGDKRVGKDFLDDVSAELDKTLRGSTQRGNGKVEASRGGGNGSRSAGTGRTFADLPADAKEACHKFSNRLVGPGRAHKTIQDWEKAYATKYFEGEQQ